MAGGLLVIILTFLDMFSGFMGFVLFIEELDHFHQRLGAENQLGWSSFNRVSGKLDLFFFGAHRPNNTMFSLSNRIA